MTLLYIPQDGASPILERSDNSEKAEVEQRMTSRYGPGTHPYADEKERGMIDGNALLGEQDRTRNGDPTPLDKMFH